MDRLCSILRFAPALNEPLQNNDIQFTDSDGTPNSPAPAAAPAEGGNDPAEAYATKPITEEKPAEGKTPATEEKAPAPQGEARTAISKYKTIIRLLFFFWC